MALLTNIVNSYYKYSSIDTCAVWHLLSSIKLYSMTVYVGCDFVMSLYVEYECIHKPRAKHKGEELVGRLVKEKELGRFATIKMTIDDLQEVARLEQRKKLGKGELSAIAIAKKLNIGLTTDDRKAFRLAQTELLDGSKAQTIPQLLGWLLFNNHLSDIDVPEIIKEHKSMGECHDGHFNEIYIEAMRCKLMCSK